MGRKPAYDTPEKLRAAVRAYFADCEEKDCLPDYAGMVLYLKLKTKEALEAFADPARCLERCGGDEAAAEELAQAYAEVLAEAALRRESSLVRIMLADSKRASVCLHLLRQKENGGYTDRPADSGEKKLVLRLEGVGGWDAFK